MKARLLLLLALLLFGGVPVWSFTKPQRDEPKSDAKPNKLVIPAEKAQPVVVKHFETAPVIDGVLDEEVWKTAAVFKDFVQTSPGDNTAPSKPTIAMMGYDSKTLYLAFHCFDDKDKIRATVARRDQVFGEDNVRVFLDTFNDQRRAYVLGFNPFGVQQDGILSGFNTDFNFDIVMESKGIIVDDGWTVEVAIPFKSLRYEAGKDKKWGIDIWRNIDRFNDEIDAWMPHNRDISGQLIQIGHITGMENISTERTLEIIPSLTIRERGRRRTTDQTFFNEPVGFEAGANIKFSI
ncbi:MAG: carbohydrate binding family 9 domain-containing protein, partial [Pyrinomonadaceae bacterium]